MAEETPRTRERHRPRSQTVSRLLKTLLRPARVRGGEPQPGTLPFYMEHLHDPIHPGASVTLLQHCYVRMLEKMRAKTNDNNFDRDCRILKTGAGEGEGNFHPPSLGMVRKILGTREAHQCERHVCLSDQHVYAFAEPGAYREHRYDECPKCATPRFDEVSAPRHCLLDTCRKHAALLLLRPHATHACDG